ncbi:hypothetical protein [Phenylobacterium deserti]|uniref:DUF3035 domain-containing protein n=1 Tax=Phenylobacterium deserti TaxID=1914756 RepID=A0A328AD67_9CAUL|nr:hypothetical protein [Phenylobacterium deserti]RAK52535.1 hypothetical protein DJ018_09990 [Phenylobacterium deserti]
MIRPLAILPLLALGACTTPLDAPLSPTLGQAVASMDAQIIPPTETDLPPESSGARGVAAVDRYQRGRVKQPPVTGTSEVGMRQASGDMTSTSGSGTP